MTFDGSSLWELEHDRRSVQAPARPAPELTWRWYVDGVVRPDAVLADAVAQARGGLGWIWFGLRDPDEAMMRGLQQQVDLHELAVEDAVEGHGRSKLDVFDDQLFLVVNTVDYVPHAEVTATSEIVSTGQIMLFVGQWYVVTTRHGGRPRLRALRRAMEAEPATLAEGPWRVLHRVLDLVVDDFTQTAVELEADVEQCESLVFAREGAHEVERPYQLKREVIEFKRAVVPLAAPLQHLHSRTFPAIPSESQAYFREVADNLVATRESIAAIDEVLTTILQAALARASVADNQDMRKISAAVAILAVPTTIGAIYGMNFENMPELRTEFGYFVVLGVMAVSMLVLFLLFRRFRWL